MPWKESRIVDQRLQFLSSYQVAMTLRLQQRKFDRFRQMFNHERPHEGLNNLTPGIL